MLFGDEVGTNMQVAGAIIPSVQSRWPDDVQFLIPGVNDTWNLFQKFSKGKMVTGRDWKAARQALHDEFQKFLENGGSPESLREDSQRFEINRSKLIGLIFNQLYMSGGDACTSCCTIVMT